jgi:hypothetical protein
MGSGMNLEQAKEYAKTMTYSQAVSNIKHGKGIKFRKATMIKLRELAEIADRLDRKTENSSEKPNNCEHITEDGVTCAKYPACDGCLDNPLNKVKGSERLVKGSEQTEPTISKMEQVDWKDQMWTEAVEDEPQTETKTETQNSNLTFEKADEPQTDCGDFANRLAYERGVKHAWEVAQKVFNSTVTFYEAEDVAKQMTDCSKCETYWNCQGQCDEIPQIEDDTPQTDCGKPIECDGCGEHICIGCEHQAKKEAWRKAQTDCGWK